MQKKNVREVHEVAERLGAIWKDGTSAPLQIGGCVLTATCNGMALSETSPRGESVCSPQFWLHARDQPPGVR